MWLPSLLFYPFWPNFVLAAFATWLVPLVVLRKQKTVHPFAARHARASLNWRLTAMSLVALTVITSIVCARSSEEFEALSGMICFYLGALFIAFFDVGFSLLGAWQAKEGEPYRYLLAAPFLRARRRNRVRARVGSASEDRVQ